jgi:CelD/BcsL family acetyltransferase involved in cellulose biosynthesis
MVHLWALIDRSISDGLARLDFLKGSERYKFQLGGSPRTLSSVRVSAGH